MSDRLILLATFGTLGDLRPFMALAHAMSHRGHRVRLIAPGFHGDVVRRSGLPHVLYGSATDGEATLVDPDLWHHRKGIGVVLRRVVDCVAAVEALIAEAAAAERCAMVCHPLLPPAADIVRSRGADLPLIAAWLAPSNLRTRDDPLTLGALQVPHWVPMFARRLLWSAVDCFGVDPFILPALNALRSVHALPPVRRFFDQLQSTADVSIGLFPAWYGPKRDGWPDEFVEGDFVLADPRSTPDLSPALSTFIDEGPLPIVFTAGTGMRQAERFFADAAEALGRIGRRGIFVTSHAPQLPPPSPTIHHEPFADFARLLPRVAAVVHHGGIGTTAEALRAGTPQLVMPFGFDQFDNGARVKALGVGDALPAARSNAGRVQRALQRLLASKDAAERCRAVARRFTEPNLPAFVAERVEDALRRASAVSRCRDAA